MEQVIDAARAIDCARRLADSAPRSILGITGPPGSGKSTLAASVCAALGPIAALVPMDGFHLADRSLDALGLRERKGAPETFDGDGYAALIDRLRTNADPVVYAPAFERDLEEPVAGAIAVPSDVRLVVTEGNYLLLEGRPWRRARRLMAEVWYVELDRAVRMQRLLDRHVRFGKAPEYAAGWIASVDEPNAALIASTRDRADRLVAPD